MSITSPARTVERLTGSAGARIGDVDFNALDEETFATIRQALLEGGVVHRPGKDPTPEATRPSASSTPTRPPQVSTGIPRSCCSRTTVRSSAPLLEYLVALASTPDLIYRHSWSAGGAVLWDNRGVMRFAVHDYEDRHRVMHRVTDAGDEPR